MRASTWRRRCQIRRACSTPTSRVSTKRFFCRCQKTSVLGVEKFSARTAPPSQPTVPPRPQQYCFRLRRGGGEGGGDDGARSADANLGSIFPSAAPTLNLRYYNQDSELNEKGYDSEGCLPHFADNDEGADPEGYNEACSYIRTRHVLRHSVHS